MRAFNLWGQLKTQLQCDWLDYWFRPKIETVRAVEFINRIAELQAQGNFVFAIEYNRGKYSIEYRKDTPQTKETNGTTATGLGKAATA